jgi:hypothetical protein
MNEENIGGLIEIGKEVVKMHPYGQAANIGMKVAKNKWTWIGGGLATLFIGGGIIYLVDKYDLMGNFTEGVDKIKDDTAAMMQNTQDQMGNIQENFSKRITDTFKNAGKTRSSQSEAIKHTVKKTVDKGKKTLEKLFKR